MSSSTLDRPGVITSPPIVYLIGLLLGLLIHYFYPIGFLSKTISVWLGVSLILLSIPISLLALLSFKRARTALDVRKPTTAIVTSGIYRFSRNPMYLSLVLLYLGIACWANSIWMLLLVVPVFIAVDRGIINREEQYLEKKFGDEYLQYKSSVRRWI